jgi:hypothetical protein
MVGGTLGKIKNGGSAGGSKQHQSLLHHGNPKDLDKNIFHKILPKH